MRLKTSGEPCASLNLHQSVIGNSARSDGVAKSHRSATRGIFNPLCISLSLWGEENTNTRLFSRSFRARSNAPFIGENERSMRISLPKIGEGPGGVDVDETLFPGLTRLGETKRGLRTSLHIPPPRLFTAPQPVPVVSKRGSFGYEERPGYTHS